MPWVKKERRNAGKRWLIPSYDIPSSSSPAFPLSGDLGLSQRGGAFNRNLGELPDLEVGTGLETDFFPPIRKISLGLTRAPAHQ